MHVHGMGKTGVLRRLVRVTSMLTKCPGTLNPRGDVDYDLIQARVPDLYHVCNVAGIWLLLLSRPPPRPLEGDWQKDPKRQLLPTALEYTPPRRAIKRQAVTPNKEYGLIN